ncbi:MAG: DUF2804 domain-containing protein [Actinomycetota bacterium]|nr:DUF2804 domain-containing protein [Actinomycetota bacterium]
MPRPSQPRRSADPPPPGALAALPYRGRFGDRRPPGLRALILPPQPMPAWQGLRPLKTWRYVGVFSPELMLCLASVRIGPARQSFWAVWDRATRRLHERTSLGPAAVALSPGRAHATGAGVTIDLKLAETAGVEAVCPTGASYAWTRKQGGIEASGTVTIEGEPRRVDARAVVDDTAAYYERHTRWRWCAGVGTASDGRELAWNLVQGVNDPDIASERTVWIDGQPTEAAPVSFAEDLSTVDGLRFAPEAVREQRQNLLLIRSRYRQPFGTFAGELAQVPIADGYGVMEEHDVWW